MNRVAFPERPVARVRVGEEPRLEGIERRRLRRSTCAAVIHGRPPHRLRVASSRHGINLGVMLTSMLIGDIEVLPVRDGTAYFPATEAFAGTTEE